MIPMLNKMPVVSLKKLLLILNPNNCVNPSIRSGRIKKIDKIKGNFRFKKNNVSPNTTPKQIPKHLAQRIFSIPKKGIDLSFI